MLVGKLGFKKPLTLELFECLVSNFPEVKIIAVSGKCKKMEEFFENTLKKYNRENDICVLDYTNKVPELMSISDFVITKPGGLTATESLVSNLPMLIINPIVGHEEQNAEFLENAGVGVWIRNNDNIKEILEKIIFSSKTLEQMKNNISKIAKPDSVREIIEILIS